MNIDVFKDEDPELHYALSTLMIRSYEQKQYRHSYMDYLDVEMGVEIKYMKEDNRKRRKSFGCE